MLVYPPQTIATPLTVIQRERLLPAPGEIFVHEGERVEPVQVIGRALVPAELRIVNVSRDLSVPASRVPKYLKVKPGQDVKKGEIVAELRGIPALLTLLFESSARPSRSPLDGIVTDSGGGRLLIEAHPKEVELRANLYGVVTRVIPQWGVSIRATGTLVQGVWGNNQDSSGVLKLMVKDPSRPIRTRSIDASSHGAVLIGGSRIDEGLLEKAGEIQVRGIIAGSLDPEAISFAREAPFPIIITEGFGSYPMSSRIFELLAASDGREAMLNANFRSQWGAVRPEVFVPLPSESEAEPPPAPDAPLKVGDTVRVIRGPYLGLVGTVTNLSAWMRVTTGAQFPAAKVKTETEEEIILVPLANLEILH